MPKRRASCDDHALRLPVAVDFNDGSSCTVDSSWATVSGGKAAARHETHALKYRLMGTVSINVEVHCTKKVLRKLTAKIESTRKTVVLPKNRGTLLETWDKNGEPGTEALGIEQRVPVKRLLTYVKSGKLRPASESGASFEDLLNAIDGYCTPNKKLWGVPIVWPLIVIHGLGDDGDDEREVGKKPRAEESSFPVSSTGSDSKATKMLTLEMGVYFSRLVFFLISCDAIKLIVSRLNPANTLVSDIEPLPDYPRCFTTVEHAERFSMAGVLKSAESPGYRAATQPDGIELDMKPYQLQSLAFMQDRESNSSRGVNGQFWQHWHWAGESSADTDGYYYAPALGEFRLAGLTGESEPDCGVKGGLLCDEMGMGKTVVVAACIVADRGSGPTLIVAPTTLLSQWQAELVKSVRPGLLEVKIYAPIYPRNDPRLKQTPEQLAAADIVITSYDALEKEKLTFRKVSWRRMCLDEMQEVRRSSTKVSKACREISSECRWMVSGTPIFTGVDDLNGELAFLRVLPFCAEDRVDGFFNMRITTPLKAGDSRAAALLSTLLRRIMIRHSKSQKTIPGGRSILELPGTSHRVVMLEPSAAERAVQVYLEALGKRVADSEEIAEQGGRQLRPVDSVLRLQREAATACHLLNGGVGCRSQLTELDRIIRRQMGLNPLFAANSASIASNIAAAVRSMSAEAALEVMMRGEVIGAFAGGSAAATLGRNEDFVRHSDAVRRHYSTNRTIALEDAATKLKTVTDRLALIDSTVLHGSETIASMRWHWAVQAIRRGRYCPLHPKEFNVIGIRLLRRLFVRLKCMKLAEAAEQAYEARKLWASTASHTDLADFSESHESLPGKRLHIERSACMTEKEAFKNAKTAVDALDRAELVQLSFAKPADHAKLTFPELSKRIADTRSQVANAKSQREKLLPLAIILKESVARSKKTGASLVSDGAAGKFSDLQAMVAGAPPPKCAICLCDTCDNPIITPCCHMYCKVCFLAHAQAATVTDVTAGTAVGRSRCPLCRRQIDLSDIIEIEATDEVLSLPYNGSGECVSVPQCTHNSNDITNGVDPSVSLNHTKPVYTQAGTDDDFFAATRVLPAEQTVPLDPTLPALPSQFLTQLHLACGMSINASARATAENGYSTKVERLLTDIAELASLNPPQKVVVFSSMRNIIGHLSSVLLAANVKHGRVIKGDRQEDQDSAVQAFVNDSDTQVLLLHAGAAASGLTLTVASTVILVEPFLKTGEELQALNRCHRIGQDREVTCLTYCMKGSVEERILAHRGFEDDLAITTPGIEALSANDDSRGLTSEKLRYILGIACSNSGLDDSRASVVLEESTAEESASNRSATLPFLPQGESEFRIFDTYGSSSSDDEEFRIFDTYGSSR